MERGVGGKLGLSMFCTGDFWVIKMGEGGVFVTVAESSLPFPGLDIVTVGSPSLQPHFPSYSSRLQMGTAWAGIPRHSFVLGGLVDERSLGRLRL